tara:strand:- start:567 stop:968 length:402 start_codon:yes stop_codon:yes gene_type:complete
MTVSSKTTNGAANFVTRPEFEAFEKSVDNNFSEIRDSQHIIGRKIDALATKGVDFKGIFAGISVLITVILAVVGLFGWALNDKIDSAHLHSDRSISHAIELSALKDRIIEVTLSERMAAINKQIQELKATVTK